MTPLFPVAPPSTLPLLDDHALTNRGKKRAQNEDTVWIARGEHPVHPSWAWSLYLVADGVGGLDAGKEASLLAAQTVTACIHTQFPRLPTLAPATLTGMLRRSVEEANRAIYEHSRVASVSQGTTITVVLLVNQQAFVANVGDSRTYLHRARASRLLQLTEDHSRVAYLVKTGQISEDEVFTHPERNVITRCLGNRRAVEVDLFQVALQPGDRLLLCSDGLWELVRPHTLRSLLADPQTAREAARALVNEANANGGLDNISAIVVDVARPRGAFSSATLPA